MKTPAERAAIARRNGAKSKGPVTAAGKEQSKRNAISHGSRATTLKLLVPPHSSVLVHEDRREFYRLFDLNIAKYNPSDDKEKFIVREITCLEWSNIRARVAIHGQLNRELLRTADDITPICEENAPIENTLAAYANLAGDPTLKHFHKEYASNLRLIASLERRLALVQREWPAHSRTVTSTTEERAIYGVEPAEPTKGTQPEPVQPVENTTPAPKKRQKTVNVTAPLTPQKIRLFQHLFPNHELKFNILDPKEPGNKAA